MSAQAPMLGRSRRRQHACQYGCCVPDYTGRSKSRRRALKRRLRRLELKELEVH